MPARKPAPRPAQLSAEELDQALDKMDPPEIPQELTLPVAAPREADDPYMGIPPEWKMIHTLMGRILADVGPVAKTDYNTTQKYNFRGVDAVVNAVNAAFQKHRVFLTSTVVEAAFRDTHTTANKPTREVTGRVRFTFWAPDGSSIDTEVMTEALDSSDKGGPKAMSVALRIALLQMLLLPTTDPTTDDNGHYHTRDGAGGMSPEVAALVLERVKRAGLDELLGPVRASLDAHDAWSRPAASQDGSASWHELFGARLAALIADAPSHDALREMQATLDKAGALPVKVFDGTVLSLLRERWNMLKERYLKTQDHVTQQVLAARGRDELRTAVGCGVAAVEAGTLTEKQLVEIEAIADDRAPKLPETAPKAAPDSTEPEAEKLDATPSESIREAVSRERYAAFRLRAEQAPIAGLGETPELRERAVAEAITDLLTGDDPASNYDADGFVYVEDAIKAAHRREQTIGDEVRDHLDGLLDECRKLSG